MFETIRFGLLTGRMFSFSKLAVKAMESRDNQRALFCLRKSLECGYKALSIESPKIDKKQRAVVADLIPSTLALYQEAVIAQMPENDRTLVMSVVKSWANMGVMPIGGSPIEQIGRMFNIAVERLDSDKNVLALLYKGEHVPVPLQETIQLFITGKATKKETRKQLNEYGLILKRWLPELFLGKPHNVQQ